MTQKTIESQVLETREAIDATIESLGISIEELRKVPYEHKVSYLKDCIPELVHKHAKPSELEDPSMDDGRSLALIKPEVFPYDEELIDNLLMRGYNILSDPELIYPTAEQWFGLYGYMTSEHPNILQNYIVHRAIGFKVVTLGDMDYERIKYLDQETGKAYEENPNTIRGSVSRRIMSKLGFRAMTGYASAFDPLSVIARSKQPDYAFYCYNGIHTPKNAAEAASNMEAFNV